ncbi:AraC family transcriptional regulator [Neorhodopirellula pilleata]|uniref:Right origin-binding protein n=1 Tax=Neorhodopirellula pilleata TaxID=2714738 RepID=A0A5C5ZYH3_9BACT|nr:helix-turn-helix domain-containing protein [Neorhodopirellula pilleata]TWT92236.1 Right origin-binding protein [Neorhodopirellula pilleata]
MPDISDNNRRRIVDTCLLMECDLNFRFTVAGLAEYADLSEFHFQRLFRQVVGESVMSHLRRLRLANAAFILKNSDCPITQVAMESGFATHAGFTHAFTKAYGQSPADFRANNLRHAYIKLPTPGAPSADRGALAACPLSVQIERTPTRRIALMRYMGPTSGMAGIWPEMIRWCRQRGLTKKNSTFLGIHYDDWSDHIEASSAVYRYDAAIEINSMFQTDRVASTTFIPGGQTALVHFHGSLTELDRTWRIFAEQWLPASGYQPRLNFVYDLYPSELILGSRLSQTIATLRGIDCTLCIPICQPE